MSHLWQLRQRCFMRSESTFSRTGIAIVFTCFCVLTRDVQHADERAVLALFHLNSAIVFERFEERKDGVSAPVPAFGKVTDLGKKRYADTTIKVLIHLHFLFGDEVLKRLET